MAGNIFQPQVAQVNSAVTPTEGVADTSAVDLFADVAKVATEATFSFTGQQELSDLNKKFDRVVQARQQGGNSSSLQVRARADLDIARANSPWIAKEAEKLFREKFSGGGSGAFEATPQEKAKEKHLQDVEEKRLAWGLSTTEEAQKRISLDENAKSAKIQADAQKDVREYNGDLVFSNTQTQLTNNSIKFMDGINRAMVQGGGTLGQDAVRSFNLTIDQQVVQLKQQLNSQTRDQETGHLLTSKASLEDNLKEIEDWAGDTKAMVADSAYMKVIQDLNTEQTAEINLIATSKYRTLKILAASGGQEAVGAYLKAAARPEGAAKQLLIGANPIAKDMFKQSGSFNQASADGVDKILLPTPANIFLSEPEALATGTVLNDPANAKVLTTTVESVATDDNAAEPFKSMIKKNTDSSAILWGQAFKSWSFANKAKGETVLTHGVDALKTSFLSAFVSDNNSLPTDFNIKDQTNTIRRKTKGGFQDVNTGRKGSFKPNVVVGQGITRESGKILSNMLSVFINNPEYAKKVGGELGMPDASPQELVRAVVLGAPEEPLEKPKAKTDTSTKETQATAEVTPEEAADVQGRFDSAMARANTPELKGEVFKALLNGFFKTSEDGGVNLPDAKTKTKGE